MTASSYNRVTFPSCSGTRYLCKVKFSFFNKILTKFSRPRGWRSFVRIPFECTETRNFKVSKTLNCIKMRKTQIENGKLSKIKENNNNQGLSTANGGCKWLIGGCATPATFPPEVNSCSSILFPFPPDSVGSFSFSLASLWNRHIWHPREFLLRNIFWQNLQVTKLDLALCISRIWRDNACQDNCW